MLFSPLCARADRAAPLSTGVRVSIKSDKWIRRMAEQHGMIEPFEPGQVKQNEVAASSPTAPPATATTCAAPASSRCSPTSTPPSSTRRRSIRPASSISRRTCASSRPIRSRWRARWSSSGFRARCSPICLGKSTYARCGIIVNVTPLEPEWEGHVTLEFSNTTPLPAKIYANEGVAQMLFLESDEECETSYKRPRRQIPGPAGRHPAAYLNGARQLNEARLPTAQACATGTGMALHFPRYRIRLIVRRPA